jgi:hypothetical protein
VQIFLSRQGEVTGPFTTDQLHSMVEAKEIGTDCHYWCEGMTEWEQFRPKRDLDQISAIKKDSYFPFESGPPPVPPWKKRSPWRILLALSAALIGLGIFLLAWKKHEAGARAEVLEAKSIKDESERYRRSIAQGASYKLEEWPVAAAAADLDNMESVRRLLGAPNVIVDDGYRWVYFDRLIHPVTETQADLAVRFDEQKKVTGFESYP